MMPSVEVRAMEAYRQLDDYLPLLENPRTACIISDQRLKVTGIATYTGIELAEFLRDINPKIPIYILTNFAEEKGDFIGGEWTVEDIVRKSELTNEEESKVLAARILRRINIYEDIKSEREKKFHSLLMKSMNGELEDAELQELDELRLQKTSASLAKELTEIRQMEQIIKAQEDLIRRFEHLT